MQITDKKIEKICYHHFTQKQAWNLFTTKEGLIKFFGVDNKIDMTPGGPYEIYFMMDNPEGLKGGETCTVLSYLPKRMLSFTWNAPPIYPNVRNALYKTWVVIEFEDGLLKLTHLGWPEGNEWHQVYEYFENAWDIVLDNFMKVEG